MVAPLVTAGVKTNEYYNIDNFKIYHHDKLFFAAQNLTSEELKERETTALVAAKVTHPGDYTPPTFMMKQDLVLHITPVKQSLPSA